MLQPIVSIILPVYNTDLFLFDSIKSILNQTYTNFEFIILDDGSTDKSLEIIQSFKDKRIKIIQNSTNLGLIKTLNIGIDLARGKYIARMDADDIAMPKRLEKQIAFLEKNTDYVLVGTMAEIIDEKGRLTGKKIDLPTKYDAIKSRILFQCPFVHPSIMGKTKVFKEFKYKEAYPIAEDLFLWLEIIQKYRVANINESLLKYRVHSKNVSSNKDNFSKKIESTRKIIQKQFTYLGITLNPNEIESHLNLYTIKQSINSKSINNFKLTYQWIEKLLIYNTTKKYFSDDLFIENISLAWYNYILRNISLDGYFFYIKSPLSKNISSIKKKYLLIHTIGNFSTVKPIYLFFKKYVIKVLKFKV